MRKTVIVFFVLIFSFTLFAQEKKKKDPEKPKVKTGVELEKGDKAPDWDKKILKKKKIKKAKKNAKKEMKKMKREQKLEKRKRKLQNQRRKK